MKDLTENDPRTYAIIGAAMEVHKQLGCGFLEPVYQEALTVEFSKCKIPFCREVTLPNQSSINKSGSILLIAWTSSVSKKLQSN